MSLLSVGGRKIIIFFAERDLVPSLRARRAELRGRPQGHRLRRHRWQHHPELPGEDRSLIEDSFLWRSGGKLILSEVQRKVSGNRQGL